MALEEIGYGEMLESQKINDNFNYLDTRITNAAATLQQNINNQGNTISSVQSNISTIQDSISTINSTISGKANDYVPRGAVIWYGKASNPSGYLYCNGAAVSRTTYADLFAVIGTTFGAGDGATTFNIPNLVDRYVKGSGTVGTALAAGLPSIGASTFIKSVTTHNADGSPSGSEAMSFIRTASSQNVASIYGSVNTVQPPSLTLRPCIKY